MSYCTGKHIEKSRGKAIKMLVIEKKPVGVIADRFGVNRTTIWRWHKKWLVQNNYRTLSNPNRPNRKAGSVFRWYDLKWDIPSVSAAPKHPHRAHLCRAHHCYCHPGRCASLYNG